MLPILFVSIGVFLADIKSKLILSKVLILIGFLWYVYVILHYLIGLYNPYWQ